MVGSSDPFDVLPNLFVPDWKSLNPSDRVQVVVKDLVVDKHVAVGRLIPGDQVVRISGLLPPAVEDCTKVTFVQASFLACTSVVDLAVDDVSHVLCHRPLTVDRLSNLVEVCAGAGISSLGFCQVGFRHRCAVEIQPLLAQLHESIHQGVPVVCADITDDKTAALVFDQCDEPGLVMAGIACQPYSRGGSQQGELDNRSLTLPGTLRFSHLIQAPLLALECVAPAAHNQYVQNHIRALQQQLNFHVVDCTLKLEHVWSACRLRWWLIASMSCLGSVGIPKFPTGSTLNVRDVMPYVRQWSPEDEAQLELSETEIARFQLGHQSLKPHAMHSLKHLVIQQSKALWPELPKTLAEVPLCHELELHELDLPAKIIRCPPSTTVAELLQAETKATGLSSLVVTTWNHEPLPHNALLTTYSKVRLLQSGQTWPSEHVLALNDPVPFDDEDLSFSQCRWLKHSLMALLMRPCMTSLTMLVVPSLLTMSLCMTHMLALSWPCSLPQLLALMPPLVVDQALCSSMRDQMLSKEVRMQLLAVQGSVWADDELWWHLLAMPQPDAQSVFVDPILVTSWLIAGTLDLLESWFALHPGPIRIVSAVLCQGHWIPCLWIQRQTTLDFHTWEHNDMDLNCLNGLHGLLSRAFGVSMFNVSCTRRSFGLSHCGAAAVLFLSHRLTGSPLPVDEDELEYAATNLRCDFQLAHADDCVMSRPWCWAAGSDDLPSVVATLLQSHGVPSSASSQRARLVIQSLGKEQVQQAVHGDRKATASKKGQKKPTGPKTMPSKPLDIDPTRLVIAENTFCTKDDVLVSQIQLSQVGPLASGVALASFADARPFLQSGSVLTKGSLALLVLNGPDELHTDLQWSSIRFAAKCSVNQQPVLLSGMLVQLGHQPIFPYNRSEGLAVPDVLVACASITVHKDQWTQDWEQFAEHPFRNVLHVLPPLQTCRDSDCICDKWHPDTMDDHTEVVLDVFRRQFFIDTGRPTKASHASHFSVQVRYLKCQEAKLLQLSGRRYGIRVKDVHFQQVFAKLKPDGQFLAPGDRQTWHCGPWPYGTDRKSLGKVFGEWKWHARPLQPAKPVQGGIMWIVQSITEPIQVVWNMQHGQVVVSKCESVHSTMADNAAVVGPQATVELCTTGSSSDPWLVKDPWQQAVKHVPQPAPSMACQLQELEDRLEKSLLKKLPQDRRETDETETRLAMLEQQMQQIAHRHQALEGTLMSTTNSTQHRFLMWILVLFTLFFSAECRAGQYSGVAVVSQVPSRALCVDWPPDLFAIGRVQVVGSFVANAWVTGAVAYGYPQSKYHVHANERTEAMLDFLFQHMTTVASGPRYMCGDWNMQPHQLEFSEKLHSLGWRECQELQYLRHGTQPQMTCQNKTQKDVLWLSPELVSCFSQVVLQHDRFPDHSTLIASFTLSSDHVTRYLWPTPMAVPWKRVPEAASPVDFSNGSPTDLYRDMWHAQETLAQKALKHEWSPTMGGRGAWNVVSVLPSVLIELVTAVDLEDVAVEISPPVDFDASRPVLLGSRPVGVIHVTDAKLYLEDVRPEDAEVTVSQSSPVGAVDQIFEAFHEQWRARWCKHDGIPHDRWNQLIRFARDRLPRGFCPMLDITPALLRAEVAKKKAHAATGLDGVSRLDLLQGHDVVLHGMCSMYQRACQDGLWPAQVAAGRVASLSKVADPQTTNEYRPITVFAMSYRCFSSLHSRALLGWADTWCHPDIYGNRKNHQTTQLWRALVTQIQQAYDQQLCLSGLTADIEKCFNCLPRWPILSVALHVGSPFPLLQAWTGALAAMTRHFKVRESFSAGFTTCTGLAEGCALSCFGMLLLDDVMHRYMHAQYPLPRTLSFVDNWDFLTWNADAALVQLDALLESAELTDLTIDRRKTFAWSTSATVRTRLREAGIPDCCLASWTFAISSATVSSITWWKHRRQAVQALNFDKAGINPLLLLGLVEVGVDPECVALLQTVRDTRLDCPADFWSCELFPQAVGLLNSPASSPCCVLLGRLQSVGLCVHADGYLEDVVGKFCPATMNHTELCNRLLCAWHRKVAAAMSYRKDFTGLDRADVALTRAALHAFPPDQQSLLRISLAGGLFTQDAHSLLNLGDGLCKWCDQQDSLQHRYFECPNTAPLSPPAFGS
eukprot:s462_g81.t1